MLAKLLEKYLPDSPFTKFWLNKKLRSIVLLILWVIFIAFVIIKYILPYQTKEQDKLVNTSAYHFQMVEKMVQYRI